MPIDFNEENEQETTLATCSQHNLKYNPDHTWGCVLCRTNQKKRISGYGVVAAVLLIAGAVFYLWPVIYPNGEPKMSAVVSVGDSSVEDSESPEAAGYACRLELSREVENCIAKIDAAAAGAQMEREFCLDTLKDVAGKCGGSFIPQNYLNEPLYNVNCLPAWASIRTPIEQDQQKIEACMGSEEYRFAARIEVSPSTGKVQNATLSLFGLDTSQRFCVYQFFESLTFPTEGTEPYTFVTRIDSTLLAQNRPEEEDNRSAEFKKFVEEHRQAKMAEEKRTAIMKKRDAFDDRFKKGMKPAVEEE